MADGAMSGGGRAGNQDSGILAQIDLIKKREKHIIETLSKCIEHINRIRIIQDDIIVRMDRRDNYENEIKKLNERIDELEDKIKFIESNNSDELDLSKLA